MILSDFSLLTLVLESLLAKFLLDFFVSKLLFLLDLVLSQGILKLLACLLRIFWFADRDAGADSQPRIEAKVDDVFLVKLFTLSRCVKLYDALVDLSLLVTGWAGLPIYRAHVHSEVSIGGKTRLLDVFYLDGQGRSTAPSLNEVVSIGLRDNLNGFWFVELELLILFRL